jgi:MarR family transcriptional regulator, organic hydroperoxide resistance regulator
LTKQNKVRDHHVRHVLDAYPRIYFACHTRHVRDPESGGDVSAHQASILDHLDEIDPMSMTDLAGHMGVTLATMSLAIDRLEDKGYVRRERDAKDGRRVLLRITDAGLRLREAKSVLDPVRVEQVLTRLSPAERARALDGLALLARASAHHMKASKDTGVRGKRTRQEKAPRAQPKRTVR